MTDTNDGNISSEKKPFEGKESLNATSSPSAAVESPVTEHLSKVTSANDATAHQSKRRKAYAAICTVLLFLNYFLAQYDKFILSYFQTAFTTDLSLSATQYGVLSGYATGIVYALLALPIAYLADYFPTSRVWVLSIAAVFWSLCVIFQGLAHNFWQVLLARLAMGCGQAAVEPLSISLISDLVGGWRDVFIAESLFYVGVYVGEAISGQIATAFTSTGTSWRVAMKAIGIVGIIVAVLVRLLIRDPGRLQGLVDGDLEDVRLKVDSDADNHLPKFQRARIQFLETVRYITTMRSFWLLVLSAGFRQLGGNVFGYYMPSFLSNTYPAKEDLLSRYGIIVGVVGTFSVMSGGVLTSILWNKTKLTPIYLTALGGMISSVFVLLMLFSRDIPGGDQDAGVRVLYGVMSAAYLTAETWLGALSAFIALLLPPRYKTFGLAIWSSVQVLVYSAGPEIVGLALRNQTTSSNEYTKDTQIVLAVMITLGYWIAGIGFLYSIPRLKKDLANDFHSLPIAPARRIRIVVMFCILIALVIALFVTSIVYEAT